MARTKGGELIADFLVREKIAHVFGICGHGNVGMLDALHDVRDKVRLIAPRHEQTAGHMAAADCRVSQSPSTSTISASSQSVLLTPAAIAGVQQGAPRGAKLRDMLATLAALGQARAMDDGRYAG